MKAVSGKEKKIKDEEEEKSREEKQEREKKRAGNQKVVTERSTQLKIKTNEKKENVIKETVSRLNEND